MRDQRSSISGADVAIIGAGIIGLSIALELRCRGASVLVLDSAPEGGQTIGQASWAAAGMLAAEDPFHPPALRNLSKWSASLYDEFLDQIAVRSGSRPPYQTERTQQFLPDGSVRELRERSIDPRQLMPSLRAAALAAGVSIRHSSFVSQVTEDSAAVQLAMADGSRFTSAGVVHAGGAWMNRWTVPWKGQMMRVRLAMEVVHRAEHVYVTPRTVGEQAGTCLVGATVEDVGFDTQTDLESLQSLRLRAAELVPEVMQAEVIEAWAGLRPKSFDGRPVIGSLAQGGRQFVAGAHFRNGVLLAPATAKVMADLVTGVTPLTDITAFRPESRLAHAAHAGR